MSSSALRSMLLCALIPVAAQAQQSLYQSSDGETSLYTQRSDATLNFGDSKATLAYAKHDNQHLVVGYEVFAKANSGTASLFASDKPKVPEGGGDFTIGRHWDIVDSRFPPPPPNMEPGKRYSVYSAPEREKWWLLDIGYSRSSFYVASTPVPASQASTNFDRYRALGVINASWYGTDLIGLAGGVERRNNLDTLQTVQFQTVVAAAPAGTSTSLVSNRAGFYGPYKTYTGVPLYFDWLHYLTRHDNSDACRLDPRSCTDRSLTVPGFGNRLALDAFARADIASGSRTAKGGLGLYVFRKDDALTPLGGVTVSYDGSRVQVGVTTGFCLGK